MPYIGNTVQTQGFTPAIDYFNGNGVTVTFTLSRPVASVAQMIVAVDNVIQNPNSAFGVSGNSITFTSAPLSGTNNIWVEYTSLITTYQGISQDPTVIGDIRATGGYLAEGDFGNSYVDGTIVDYVTGNARITTGPADGLTIYNGGTSARTALMTLDTAGNMGVGTITPNSYSTQKSVTINGSAFSRVDFQVGGTGTAYMYSGASNTNLGPSGASATLGLDTNGNTRLLIDSSGRITTPYQPFFYATLTADQNGLNLASTGDAVVIYNSLVQNVGSNYSTSTGKFTAPVAGVYAFYAAAYSSVNTFSQSWLVINGSRGDGTDWSNGSSSNFMVGHWIVKLSANDTVGYHPYNGSISSGNITANTSHTYFRGTLLG
jgi:hypothetical protein